MDLFFDSIFHGLFTTLDPLGIMLRTLMGLLSEALAQLITGIYAQLFQVTTVDFGTDAVASFWRITTGPSVGLARILLIIAAFRAASGVRPSDDERAQEFDLALSTGEFSAQASILGQGLGQLRGGRRWRGVVAVRLDGGAGRRLRRQRKGQRRGGKQSCIDEVSHGDDPRAVEADLVGVGEGTSPDTALDRVAAHVADVGCIGAAEFAGEVDSGHGHVVGLLVMRDSAITVVNGVRCSVPRKCEVVRVMHGVSFVVKWLAGAGGPSRWRSSAIVAGHRAQRVHGAKGCTPVQCNGGRESPGFARLQGVQEGRAAGADVIMAAPINRQ